MFSHGDERGERVSRIRGFAENVAFGGAPRGRVYGERERQSGGGGERVRRRGGGG